LEMVNIYMIDYTGVCSQMPIDPENVAKLSTAVARGLTFSGIAPSPKHFPGHGDTHVDSHLGLPRILKSKEQLEATELVPFKQLASSGVATIMTGHMALPLIVGDDTPCSLSRKITTDLLRTELGFEGVVVTDCLEMDAVVDSYGSEKGAVKALQAGADVAMICHRIDRQKGAIEATYEAVQSGALSLEELRVSGKRIQSLKERFAGSWDEVLKDDVDLSLTEKIKRDSVQISEDAYKRTIAVVRDTHKLLPLLSWKKEPVLVFTPVMETLNRAVDDAENIIRTANGKLRNTAGPSYTAFASAIHERLPHSTHVVYGPGDTPPAGFESAKRIVFATRSADRSTWQLEYLQSLLRIVENLDVVVLATLTPYEVLFPVAGTRAAYMCSFEFTPQALRAAVGAMFHESPIVGSVPVKYEKV
jgi:beta-N-acetylhexosaminidase